MFLLLAFLTIIGYFTFRYSRRNLYKHSSKIPGVPTLPLVGNANLISDIKDLRQTCHKLADRCGYTFKIWLFYIHVVLVANPKHLKIILNSPDCLDKDKRYHIAKHLFGDNLLVVPGEIWKRQRKMLNPTFGKKIVDSFVEIFIRHSEILVQQLEKEVGKSEPFDSNDYISKCSLDFICETAMGVSVDAQIKESPLLTVFNRIAEIIVMRALTVWLHLEIVFKYSSIGREMYRIYDKYIHQFIYEIIEERHVEIRKGRTEELVFDENEKKPFLDHLLTLKEKLTLEEIYSQVQLFIAAGSDTVGTTVDYCLVVLGMYKDIQEKVRQELQEVFGDSNRPFHSDDLNKLKYLTMVLKETLRLYPPIPFVARTAKKNIDLEDFVIPRGSPVIIFISGVHRNPEYWDNPLEFNPDRFLPEEVAKRHPYSFIPFSGGPRNCIGLTYAMTACKIILATVLRSYKIDTKLTPETIRFRTEITSKIEGGANITIQKV